MNTIERQEYQKKILQEGNLQIGSRKSLPVSLKVLKDIEAYPYLIKEKFQGLTAQVFHLEIEGKHYNLKRVHHQSKVKNEDGKLAFLNEILRRRDLLNQNEIIKNQTPKTIYASLKEGMILSNWIDGDLMHTFNKETITSLYTLLFELEKIGLFEWDLCRGNLIEKDGRIYLFDFGYMYPFDPLNEYNPEGLLSIFHMVERFETRTLMPYLFDLEETNRDQAMRIFRENKAAAREIYQKKRDYLIENQGSKILIQALENHIHAWEKDTYLVDQCRSFILDIHDDLSGKSCTKHTLKKIRRILEIIDKDYSLLKDNGLLFFDNKALNKVELIKKYTSHYQDALTYQIQE